MDLGTSWASCAVGPLYPLGWVLVSLLPGKRLGWHPLLMPWWWGAPWSTSWKRRVAERTRSNERQHSWPASNEPWTVFERKDHSSQLRHILCTSLKDDSRKDAKDAKYKCNYKFETRNPKFETNGKQNSKHEFRNSKQKGKLKILISKHLKTRQKFSLEGFGFWELRFWNCFVFRYSDFGVFPRWFWILIFEFGSSGLFEISSFGIRILIWEKYAVLYRNPKLYL